MSEVKLTASDQDLLGQMARFAERMAGEGGVYYNRSYSMSLGKPVVTLIAIGEENASLLDRFVVKRDSPIVQPFISMEKNDGSF